MKITGLITEYNPFHNGHSYHLTQSKKITGADLAVAVMSGDFVQRGVPAIFDKYTRAKMALKSGVDLVLEIPSPFATGSAEDFAAGSIALLDKLGVVDCICFGSESGSIQAFMQIASVLMEEPQDYTAALKEKLKEGLSFPDARNQALLTCRRFSMDPDTINAILSSPNNILGIEYCKALLKQHSTMTPYTIKRIGSHYHETKLSESLSSASSIRQALGSAVLPEEFMLLRKQVPDSIWPLFEESRPIYQDDISTLLNYSIISKIHQGEPLSDYADMSKELESRLTKSALSYASFEDRIAQLKTKQYTYTRISRALLHLILNIKNDQMQTYLKENYISYARVLGFRQTAKPLLKKIKTEGRIPLITKTADAVKTLTATPQAMLLQDIYSSHIYQTIYSAKYQTCPLNEYNQPITIL